jgi:hypothetical protein
MATTESCSTAQKVTVSSLGPVTIHFDIVDVGIPVCVVPELEVCKHETFSAWTDADTNTYNEYIVTVFYDGVRLS